MRASERWVVVFSGGGTGGHLYPALALAGALRALRPDVRAFFIGARRGLEARILPARGEEHLLVQVEGFRRDHPLTGNLPAIVRLLGALAETGRTLHRLRPRVVVVTGGYAGGPAGLMAVVMRIRLVLQEQNAVPGVTTRALSLFAQEVHLAFPEAAAHLPRPARGRVHFTGNPVVPPLAVEDAHRSFGLDPLRPIVLVVGGSQGSLALNRGVLDAVTQVIRGNGQGRLERPIPDLQLLWSTGPAHLEEVQDALESLGNPSWVQATGYIEEMPAALGIAAVAVSRAGAMATSEFLAWGIPSILVPLPTAAADHQTRNARALHEAGAAILLSEEELDGRVLWSWIARIIGDPAARARMARAALDRGQPGAAETLARSLERALPPARTGGVKR